MKKIFFAGCMIAFGLNAAAQSVGIGTTTPNSSAQLDITSNNKGLLMPRLSTAQRISIASPANGLMVYDTTLHVFYFYNGSAWGPVSSGGGSGSSWTATGNNIYNSNTGNVGIGVSTPTAKLHLAGLMKIDDGQIDIDDNIAQVRLIDGGSPKGFFKLAGSSGDIQLGTYVGANDAGKLQLLTKTFPRVTIEPDGNVGVGTINPAYKLDVRGDIYAEGDLRIDDGFVRINNTTTSKNWEIQNTSSLGGRLLFLQQGLERLILNNDGNIGVGAVLPLTSNGFPKTKLHIESGQDAGLTASNNGYVMVGPGSGTNIVIDNNEIVARNGFTTASTLYLQNNGGELVSGARLTVNKDGESFRINGNNPQMGFYLNDVFKSFIGQTNEGLYMGVNGGNLRLDATGQIAIGNVIPAASAYKLTVTGKVICEELKVQLRAAWPDYVFAGDYKLKPLQEVEQFITTNKHLPNIPSAAEVEKNGIEVGGMQKKMMEKIEELTLYIIDLQKQVDALKRNSK